MLLCDCVLKEGKTLVSLDPRVYVAACNIFIIIRPIYVVVVAAVVLLL